MPSGKLCDDRFLPNPISIEPDLGLVADTFLCLAIERHERIAIFRRSFTKAQTGLDCSETKHEAM